MKNHAPMTEPARCPSLWAFLFYDFWDDFLVLHQQATIASRSFPTPQPSSDLSKWVDWMVMSPIRNIGRRSGCFMGGGGGEAKDILSLDVLSLRQCRTLGQEGQQVVVHTDVKYRDLDTGGHYYLKQWAWVRACWETKVFLPTIHSPFPLLSLWCPKSTGTL